MRSALTTRLIFAALLPTLAFATGSQGQRIRKIGTVNVAAIAAGKTTEENTNNEIREELEVEVNRKIPRSSFSGARTSAAHIPSPTPNALTGSNPGLIAFNGISHYDQRMAGTGIYAGTQFSNEPPDQAFCISDTFIVESVNTALRVFSRAGAPLSATIALNEFFHLAPGIIRNSPTTTDDDIYGDFVSDPKCLYDRTTQRFFLTVLQADSDPKSGDFKGPSSILVAVSATPDPLGNWNIFKLDTTNNGDNETPTHKDCPCFGDQPLIGADANGFYVSTNEFPSFVDGFNGAQIYALSKSALAAGVLPAVASIDLGKRQAPDNGTWYTVQPATSPGTTFETAANGTEYFLSALEFNGGVDNRIALWALKNTASLNSGTPSLTLDLKILDSIPYGVPPAAEQANGPRPLAESLGTPREKLELLDSGDDRMQQVIYANGKVWGSLGTVVKNPTGPSVAGVAWFIVSPSVATGTLNGTMLNQGYVSLNGEYLIYPAVAASDSGKAAIVFTVSGPNRYPSAGYTTLSATAGAGDVHIGLPGVLPEDGFTGYSSYGGGGRTARWGDYSAAVADAQGNLWMATEYIPGGPRTTLANWGTAIMSLMP